MLKDTAQLFDALVHFVRQHGYGEVYTRDPRQEVPADCGFVRFRTPGGVLFTSAGLVKFRTREDGGDGVQDVCRGLWYPNGSANEFPASVSPHVRVAHVCAGAGGHAASVAPVETRLGRMATLEQRSRPPATLGG